MDLGTIQAGIVTRDRHTDGNATICDRSDALTEPIVRQEAYNGQPWKQ